MTEELLEEGPSQSIELGKESGLFAIECKGEGYKEVCRTFWLNIGRKDPYALYKTDIYDIIIFKHNLRTNHLLEYDQQYNNTIANESCQSILYKEVLKHWKIITQGSITIPETIDLKLIEEMPDIIIDTFFMPMLKYIRDNKITLVIQPDTLEDNEDEWVLSQEEADLLIGTEYRIAQYCKNEMRRTNSVHSVSYRGKYLWYYESRTKLWEEGTVDTLAIIIMKNLSKNILPPLYRKIKHALMKCKDYQKAEYENDLRHCRSLIEFAGTLCKCRNIATIVFVELFNPKFINQLDSNNDCFPTKGGYVLNLRTGEYRERISEDYFTFESPIVYDPNITNNDINQFLNDIVLGNEELKEYLQVISGICLTGHNHLKKFYIFYGPKGNNAKSTFTNMMRRVLGDFYVQASKEVFIDSGKGTNAGACSSHICELRGKRLCVFSEFVEGDRFNEGLIKTFTGGDPLKGNPKGRDLMEFVPRFKAWTPTNIIPAAGPDRTFWVRQIIFPWFCEYVELKPGEVLQPNQRIADPNFGSKVMDNAQAMSAFLSWLVEGAKKLYTQSINTPQICLDLVTEEREKQDIYTRFFQDEVEYGKKIEENTLVGEMNRTFDEWCKDAGVEIPKSIPKSRNIVKFLGEHHSIKVSGRTDRYYVNCRLINRKTNNITLDIKNTAQLQLDNYNKLHNS